MNKNKTNEIILYRYEFFNENDESLNVGLFAGFSEFNILSWSDQQELIYIFNKKLKVPPLSVFMIPGSTTKSFFTRKGIQKFFNQIENVLNYVHNETNYKIKLITSKINPTELNNMKVYEDEHQILTIVN